MLDLLNFVEDPRFVVFDGVVANRVEGEILRKSIDDFDLLERNHDTATRAAGDVVDFVRLDCNLYLVIRGDVRNHHVPAGFSNSVQDCTTTIVDGDVAFVDLVEGRKECRANEEVNAKEEFGNHLSLFILI